jgi:hypothetical protein
MISGWEDFLTPSNLKEYFRTKNPVALNQAKRKEAEVDACIEHRRQKTAEAGQKRSPFGG